MTAVCAVNCHISLTRHWGTGWGLPTQREVKRVRDEDQKPHLDRCTGLRKEHFGLTFWKHSAQLAREPGVCSALRPAVFEQGYMVL